MADLPALPTPGQKPWSLNPHITAMNAELNGRLSPNELNNLVDTRVENADISGQIEDYIGTVGGVATVQSVSAVATDVAAITADPVNAVTSIRLTPTEFIAVQGAPTVTTLSSRLPIWSLSNAAAHYIATTVRVPSHWAQFDIWVWWTNLVANTGNVSWSGQMHQWQEGESLNATPSGSGSVVAADATPFLAKRSKISANIAVNPARSQTIRIMRNGDSANDTLPNAVGLVAVELVKV